MVWQQGDKIRHSPSLGDFNISANKIKMRPEWAKWDQISLPGPIFEKNNLCVSVPSDSIAGSPSQTYIKC